MEVVKVKEATRGLAVNMMKMETMVRMGMLLMMFIMMINLMSNGEEGEVDDEKENLVAEQDVGHEGDQGKPGGGNVSNLSLV